MRSRSSYDAASVKVTTRISGGVNARTAALQGSWPSTSRTYSIAI
ncbi:MAG: hypothetical protein QOH33_2396, partial [Paraburkholderia sp.]|nr:hypothetical protein [Paraburkholderia sp.]